ncbi:MAG TPA: NPCBM/NEW2 domain-containing protein [Candidatus Hydrogenedentes bacterium]|nr:NPCBM/NEW2 domain-containing protein [Candidatus Hydrogenedentota bacterium]
MRAFLAFVAGGLTALAVLGHANAQAQQGEAAMDMKSLIDSMVSHTQGWGVLGLNGAAHAPDKEAEPLVIGDQTYPEGLGAHAPSETVFILDGQFLSFDVRCGVHRQKSDMGTVIFKVVVDDTEVFNSGVMRQTDPPQHVHVSVKGASELRLETEDAGDGITCDMANWANPVLTPDPEAAALGETDSVDIAPFACVAAWDPARTEGTKASRIQSIPEDDLFTRTELVPDAQGFYEAKVYADGRACIGLEWLERRRLRRLLLEFAEPSASLEGAEVQYWSMTQRGGSPGGSRWQGQWKPLAGAQALEGSQWVITPDWSGTPEAQTGALKLRWIVPSAGPVRVRALHAYSASRWQQKQVIVETRGTSGSHGTLVMYNGELVGTADPHRIEFALGEPIQVTVRCSTARRWELADRTVMRFRLPDGAFGVAADDVIGKGAVYVEYAGLLVCDAAKPQTIDAYVASVADEQTLLERVRDLPDQTVVQAMQHIHRLDGDLGPTMLSLACDNHKFIVDREGVIQFDDRPEVYNHIESMYGKPYACRMAPTLGSGKPACVSRQPEREWMPIPVRTAVEGELVYGQRTFVAPFGKADAPAEAPWYLSYRPLGVAELTATNRGDQPANASLALNFTADTESSTPAEVRIENATALVEKNGKLLALVRLDGAEGLDINAEPGVLRVTGTVPAKKERGITVFFPRWEGAQAADLDGAPSPNLLVSTTEAYWNRVMDEAMPIDVPDHLCDTLIPASQMHCMLAARNENGVRIAPWIGSWHYGPLESEAHSIIRGMMAMGHLDFARRSLEYFIERYSDDGFLTTGYTVMGTGWHLWTLGEYYDWTRDAEWLRAQAPKVEKVCRWIMRERRKTMHTDARGDKVPEYGLMPPGVGADWEVYAYYFSLNGYYCAGLRSAAAALADIDWLGAQEMLEDAAAYEDDIRRAYAWIQGQAPVFPLRDGTWVPEYPTHAFAPCPVENLYVGEDFGRSWCYDVELGAHHLVPFGILDPKSPQVDWMMNHMEDCQFLRSGWFYFEDEKTNEADWFNIGGFAKVQPYYARTGEVHAMRDDVKPFIRTYFNSFMSLLNREDLSLWEHFINGAYNKTHETGHYLHQTRLMFVQERGDELWLAPFITNNWMLDGLRVTVRHAPTRFGSTAYTITSHVAEGHIDARIEPPARLLPKAVILRLRHPDGRAMTSADVSGAKEYRIDPTRESIRIVPTGEPVTVRAHYEP